VPVSNNKLQGFSLLELLIALIVFSIGLLAIAGLQTVSKQANFEALQRTAASQIAFGLLEDMRINGDAMAVYLAAGELGNVIYFEFDSSEVRAADQELVTRHAMQLTSNARLRVRLEGHADERGSREYNIGLGERRAQAVRQMLMIQGVSPEQISTVSFGEERPLAFGSSEADYAQNRRVEFKYTN